MPRMSQLLRDASIAIIIGSVVALAFILSRLLRRSKPTAARPPPAFVRAQGGLCNKLHVVLSYREACVVDGGAPHLMVVWVPNDECPAHFRDLFEPLEGVTFVDTDDSAALRALGLPEGATLPRGMHSHPTIVASDGARESSMPRREAAMFLQLRPRPEIARDITRAVARCGSDYCAVHVRRTDHAKACSRRESNPSERVLAVLIAQPGTARAVVGLTDTIPVGRLASWQLWGISTSDDEFFRFVDAQLCGERSAEGDSAVKGEGSARRLFLATDNTRSQAAFASRYGAGRVCTVAPIEESPPQLRHTPVHDAVVDMYVCAAAASFKGTRGSTFSDAIWALREARGTTHQADQLHTSRQLRRRRWRQQKAQAQAANGRSSGRAHMWRSDASGARGDATGLGAGPAGALTTEASSSDCSGTGASPGLHVVVAHYSWRTYEGLIEKLAAEVQALTIYDKSEEGLLDAPAGHHVVRVPNTGRESESYLNFVLERYDDTLPPYTLFIQDDVHVHVPPHHAGAFCERVRTLMRQGSAGEVLRVAHRGRKLHPPRTIDARDVLYSKLRAACERFGLEMPSAYETNVCAFLLVSRDAIRRRPRSLYEALHAWHGEQPSVRNRRGASEAELAPWLLEHMWALIFFSDA